MGNDFIPRNFDRPYVHRCCSAACVYEGSCFILLFHRQRKVRSEYNAKEHSDPDVQRQFRVEFEDTDVKLRAMVNRDVRRNKVVQSGCRK